MASAQQRALFDAAVVGDLEGVKHFFSDPSVASNITQTNTRHREIRERELEGNRSPFRFFPEPGAWYRYVPGEDESPPFRYCLFHTILRHNHLDVLQWFVSATGCESIADTMRGLVDRVANAIVRHCRDAAPLEILLGSYLFTELLTPLERKFALEELEETIDRHGKDDLLRVVVAHGVEIDEFSEKEKEPEPTFNDSPMVFPPLFIEFCERWACEL
ncbi:hypothetical protein Poli38472_012288 [Pythium oligandrum]|uniref:Uncharacterized protein n=1 Tax=Pythium oligandrum TaxID=41045 RepID=A0A8K1FPR4_PYTOL|nr:hypothetical protein Poli38472_012288 [Pythium oligandrum]|eukprot:TMW67172.1 hypothetical protein Poli38472_012288 [Pythium oligandrum]